MIDKILFVQGDDDDAGAVFNQNDGELISVIDTYHGEEVNEYLLEKLGIDVATKWHGDFITEEEYECSDCTNIPPSFELLKKRVKEHLKK